MKKLSPSKNKIEELQEMIKELQEKNDDLQKVRFNSEVFSYSPTSSHSEVSESLK